MNTLLLKISTVAAYVVMVFMNYLAIALPLGGRDTKAISDSYPNLFAPAGYAFSIWGLIYLLLGAYVVFQLWHKNIELTGRLNRLFVINALLNATWICAWHYNVIWLSVLIMLGILFTLIRIADICRISTLNTKERWLVRLPFSVYFGWITVATMANITVFLVYVHWNGFGFSDVFWTVLVLGAGALIGTWRLLKDRTISYTLVLIWAYGAILQKHISADGFAGQYPIVIAAASICLVVFAGSALLSVLKNVRSFKATFLPLK